MIKCLKDPYMDVRYDAAVSLGFIKDKSSVPALIDALKDQHILVRETAALGLKFIGDTRALPALRKIKDKYAREAIKAILKKNRKTILWKYGKAK